MWSSPDRAAVAGWGTLALLAFLASGRAAASPEGILQGFPTWAVLVGLFAALALLVALAGRGAAAPCLGLAPLLVLFVLPFQGLHALTGPPLFALVLAGVALAAGGIRPAWARLAFLPAVFLVYGTVAARVQSQVGPEGDEPHYLMVADSLLRDHDLSLERDYAEGRYRSFHPADLAPHYRVRGKAGEIYSLHAVGLSILVLPAYALGGYPGASFFMALLAALLALELRGLLRDVVGGDAAEGAAWIVALSPPLVHYAGLIFTEVPAALIVATALRRGRAVQGWRALGLGTAIAFLPWLNVRYSILAVLLVAYALAGRVRQALAVVAPVLASALALAQYHHALYGFYDPRRVYGRHPELSLASLPEGLQGLLLDQEFGLLVYAPVFVLALPGLASLLRERRALFVTGVALAGAVLMTAGAWPMWRGGWNPPARFLVPVLPVLAIGVAAGMRRGLAAPAALLVGWSLWAGLAGAAEPRLVHRDRDGTAPLFRELSGAEEWTRLLPEYVLSEPDRYRLALVWSVALALAAAPWRPRAATAPRVALAAATLVAAAGAASALSSARTGGRDAARLVGRPALALPGWSFTPSAAARWGPEDLGWGPAYEPHRYPDGAEIGARLALPPGRYVLQLEGEDLGGGGGSAPILEVRPEGRGTGPRGVRLVRGPNGLSGSLDVASGERATTLLLRGGGPFLVRSIRLTAQPFANGPV